MLRENFATLRALRVDVDDATALADAVMAGRRDELLARARDGLVREGHGDLRAEHVLLERGIEIVDCVEFDPALRRIDTGLDLAFLVMDVLRRGRELAAALVDGYRAAGGDPGDDALLTFFTAQRALIRAKVALIRASQVDGADAVRRRADAAGLLALGGRLGWEVRLGRLAAICGPAASGKSTLASALGARSGARVLSSDIVRKRLLGIAPTARAPLSAYDEATNLRTYAALGREAARQLDSGEAVLVDATFRYAGDREAFAEALGAVEPLWIECRVPADVAARRAATRGRGVRTSDADADVAARSVAEFTPVGRGVAVDTTGDTAATVATLRGLLDERLRGSGGDVDQLVLERVPHQLGA
jgi:hypothetical protein